jgi:hypothetical protein
LLISTIIPFVVVFFYLSRSLNFFSSRFLNSTVPHLIDNNNLQFAQVDLRKGAVVGPFSTLQPVTTMEPNSSLGALSLLMKYDLSFFFSAPTLVLCKSTVVQVFNRHKFFLFFFLIPSSRGEVIPENSHWRGSPAKMYKRQTENANPSPDLEAVKANASSGQVGG